MLVLQAKERIEDIQLRLSIVKTKLAIVSNPKTLVSIDTDDAYNEVEELLAKKRLLEHKLNIN